MKSNGQIVVLSARKEDLIPLTQRMQWIFFLTKWIFFAFQPKEFNLKILLHHKITIVWPSKHKKQLPYMQWNILLGHKQMS